MHRYLKRTLIGLLAVIVLLCLFYIKDIAYGISQGIGQMRIIWNAEPVGKVLKDPAFPDSLKSRILLVQEIRRFAFDSLGLDPSENYTTVYNQHGKPILWVVTAAEPYELKAKEWSFPFLGSFSYKGFFDREKAVKEENRLKEEGYDTDISEVSGWSTLGWFKDPILTNMLKKSPGNLANLIIHELTHGTLYVKNNVKFNENLASFVGDKGALRFLVFKFGKDSREYREYIQGRNFNNGFTERVLGQGKRLDSLYGKIKNEPETKKKAIKSLFLKEISKDLINYLLNFKFGNKTKIVEEVERLDNTFFLDYRRYEENLGQFETEYRQKFNSDIKKYIKYLKEIYPSM